MFEILKNFVKNSSATKDEEATPQRLTQEEAIKETIEPWMTRVPKFCGHCGSFILDKDLRSWHVANEHPDMTLTNYVFCLICGDHVGSSPKERKIHYRRHSPDRSRL